MHRKTDVIQGGAGVMASSMDHFFQRIARFSLINVTRKSADEACISVDAQYDSSRREQPPKGRKAVRYPCSGLANALRQA
jgi:hypothetical protein